MKTIYQNGKYSVVFAFGEYFVVWHPMGPARSGYPTYYPMTSFQKKSNAIRSCDMRQNRNEPELWRCEVSDSIRRCENRMKQQAETAW